mmetsp:Transcript_112267/g.312008  ORF Transcript_112267/g.312008 Transcript_112267/m.312008 type:complete len:435 (-) Transcript_112267:285-1589(-)
MAAQSAAALGAWLCLASAASAAPPDACRAGGGQGACENLLLQVHGQGHVSRGAAASFSGLMTMWSDSPTTVVGGSCEYANAAQGGLASTAAASPYVQSRAYCAADDALYRSGAACGSCYRVSYDGSTATNAGRAGSLVVQIVDSGSAKTFDCHMDAFEQITGARTGIFPVTYEAVDCDVSSSQGPAATVLDGMNPWHAKVVFSNLPQSVATATMAVGGQPHAMYRVGGATWSVSLPGSPGATSFEVVLEGGARAAFDACFETWPVATGASCAGSSAAPVALAAPARCFAAGDAVYLRAHTGKRVTAQDEDIHAKWDHRGSPQTWTLAKDAAGEVLSGDSVYLKAHTGKHMTIRGESVQAEDEAHDGSQRLVLESADGQGGRICDGSAVYLKAPTGKRLAVRGGDVHANSSDGGGRQRFVVEQAPAAAVAQTATG